MAGLVIVSPQAVDGDRSRGRAEVLARAGLASSLAVRVVVSEATTATTIASVPVERLLPDPRTYRSADPGRGAFDDLLRVPDVVATGLQKARLHPSDLVVLPTAEPADVVGLLQWLDGSDGPGCSCIVGLGPASHGDATDERTRLHRAVAAHVRRSSRGGRLLFVAPGTSARWHENVGFAHVVPGDLAAPEQSTVTDLFPPWPASARVAVTAIPSDAVDQSHVRRSLGFPEDALTVVIWGPDGVETVLERLAAVPWSATVLAIVVGARPAMKLPFTMGTLGEPASDDERRVLAALGDLHVMAGLAPRDDLVRTIMEQGGAVLHADSQVRNGLPLSAAIPAVESLGRRLAGLLLRRDLVRALGRSNRSVLEGALCRSA